MTTLGSLISDPAIGIDTARWQGDAIPWADCLAAGIRFAVVKHWHGPWRGDAPTRACADRQYAEAKAAGLLVGRYAWWLPRQPAEAQVAAWCAVSCDDDLPLTIDVEEPDADKGGATLADLERIVERVEQLTGRKPMIYSGKWFADSWLGARSDVLAACPYWHAAYPKKKAKTLDAALVEWLAMEAPALPLIWRDQVPAAWQLDGTDDASGTGALRLPNGVDVDVDLADWQRLRALVPALRDTDPATPFDPSPPALRVDTNEKIRDEVSGLALELRGLSTLDTEDIT